jgi:hypothetical protein
MIVGYSRAIALAIYRKLLELRPAWADMTGVRKNGTASPAINAAVTRWQSASKTPPAR